MPELPEVETVVRTLRPSLVGRQVKAVRFSNKRLRRSGPTRWTKNIIGQSIQSIDPRGKWIIVSIDEGAFLVHLGMTGQLTVGPAERQLAPHTHVRIDLDKDQQLRFRHERRFGSFSHFRTLRELNHFLDEKLGPEPFHLDTTDWRERLIQNRQ